MSMKHKITLLDIADFWPEIRLAGSHNKYENKALDMRVDPIGKYVFYIVKNNKRKVYVTGDIDDAIRFYNNL